ncbi:FtsX-like permease family protein [Dermatophilus congolensis]|uniref:FtsX-like permease family protein n=1 Tax=Dermatophilus congolensis TaxID=1863 RepID=UPI001AAE2AA0|nr:FtsX-like permease family protein [Dermatophilus congolensis]MBO3142859.1 hypothetical protein [Dermatophilus congolensis]MBO3151851.1 hypothetical protein [Dermatophilus congolensis]MBO3161145.1 hypothetical protein [Dermatophilus congolensis]MBO3163134.1 hypothetical protein [Dermatophilus congolensis]MBO3176689.1 hypothetical protein [Dermatophilus congolensis]
MRGIAGVSKVSLRLLGFHRRTYMGLALVVLVVTAMAGAMLLLMQGLRGGHVIAAAGTSAVELAQMRLDLQAIGLLLQIILVLTVSIAMVLVAGSVRTAIHVRSQELRMLRLNGATAHQLQAMVAVETAALTAMVGVVGGVTAVFLTHPLFAAYQAIGSIGRHIMWAGHLDLGALTLFVLTEMALVALIGFVLTGRLAKDLESTPTRHASRRRSAVGLLIRLTLVGVSVAVLFGATNTTPQAGQLAVLLPVFVTTAIGALTPWAITWVAAVAARAGGRLAPGVFTLTAARAWSDRRRLSSVALPMVIAVGLLGGFLFSSAADGRLQLERAARQYQYASALDGLSPTGAVDAANSLQTRNFQAIALTSTSQAFIGATRTRVAGVSDPAGYVSMLSGSLTGRLPHDAGSTAQIPVLASTRGAALGREVDLTLLDGSRVRGRVVMTATGLPDEAYYLPISEAARHGQFPSAQVLTTATPHQLQQFMSGVAGAGAVKSKEELLAQAQKTRMQSSLSGNLSIFGMIYVMALVSLIQTTTLTTRSRAREFTLLRRIGLSGGNIFAVTVAEAVVVGLAVTALLFASFMVVALKFAHDLHVDLWASVVPVLIPVALVLLAVVGMYVALVATCTHILLRSKT